MFMQQDWLMRQIEMMVSTVLRLLNIETSQNSALPEEVRQTGSCGLEQELACLLQKGQLGKAEDLLFEHLSPGNREALIIALDFYRQANALSDQELEAQDFTREELWEGLSQAVQRCGLELPGLWELPSDQ